MKKVDKKIINSIIYFVNTIFFIFFLSLTSTLNNDVLIDAKISDFVRSNIDSEIRFLHTTISRKTSEDLSYYNQKSVNLQKSIRTDFNSYSSYITFEKDEEDDFVLFSDYNDISFQTKILYLPFRTDVNRTFLESIRLRQYRIAIDSRYVEPGFDFSFYISSFMADRIISESKGHFTNYDEILDFDGHGIEFEANINGVIRKAHIRNIFYIESVNKISVALNYYLDNFILFYGNKDLIFQGYNEKFNYDFISTNGSIENNLKMLNGVDFGDVEVFNNGIENGNEELISILPLIKYNYEIDGLGVLIIVITICLLVMQFLYYFRFSKSIYSKCNLKHATVFLGALFLFHFVLKTLSYFESTVYYFFLFSNFIFGYISLILVLSIFTFLYLYINKVKKFKQLGGANDYSN